ncbi:MAG: PRC-barrel domain-containing protein [Leptolyngbya sp. BL-A-14]
MRKGSDVIGKVVVTYDTGERIERVRDLLFDQEGNQILGFLVQDKGMFRDARVIPLEEVLAIGADAIVVGSHESVVKAHKHPEIKAILRHNNVLKGTKILTTDGLDLGTLVDLFFDNRSGAVTGYESSGGLFSDVYSGRSFVPAPKTLKIGRDVAFVPPETAELMREQVGGLRGGVQAVGGKLQESADTAGRKLQESADTASRRLQETADATNRKLQESAEVANLRLQEAGQAASAALQAAGEVTADRLQEAGSKFQDFDRSATATFTNRLVDPNEQRLFVVGRRVEQDLFTQDNTILALQGQEVTPTLVERADQLGMLDALYVATGGSVTEPLSRNLQQTAAMASDRIQDVTQGAAEAIRQSATALAAHTTVDQAKGRRVSQMVQTADGFIIAAPGQIVTDAVIVDAQQYGQEAALLNAVGLAPAEAVRSRADEAWSEGRSQLRDRTTLAQENLSNFWQTLQEKAQELQGRSAHAIKQQRIEQALGRPVTRVILDPQDNVILNVGELITHRAIRLADEGGVLNVLLSSVYTKEPTIDDREIRASEHGTAALESYHQPSLQPN